MKVVIVGGGISGLATAYLLSEKAKKGEIESPLNLTLLEGDSRLGGNIWSEKVDGFLCERGANGFLDNKPWTLELCDKLGISDRLLRTNDSARKRFIYSEGKLHQLPESVLSFFLKSQILSVYGKLRILLEPFTKKPKEGIDETIADFVKRHIGEESLRKLVGPMVSGVFAGDPYRLSLKSSFPIMAELEKEGDGSLVKAMFRRMKKSKEDKKEGKAVKKGGPTGPGGILTSFKEGIEYLIHILGERLGGKVATSTEVQSIEKNPQKDHPYIIYFKDKNGEGKIDADVVVLATPSYVTAKMIEILEPNIADMLNEIPSPPIVVICLGYNRSLISHPLDGFGFLIPHEERMNILGCLWDSSMYEGRAPEGYVLLRAMVGGARRPEMASLKDDELIKLVRKDLEVILEIDVAPEFIRIYRHEKAIPQYIVGHSERMRTVEEALKKHPGLFLTGNSYYGIGINDCVREAFKTAENVTGYIKNQIQNSKIKMQN
jgi:oxygen-dependent protoporphyrinogen oxidase